MGDKGKGIYEKFSVKRLDGGDDPGGKHEGCQYFILDISCDPHALSALRAYAQSCAEDYPLLSADLLREADGLGRRLEEKAAEKAAAEKQENETEEK